MYERYSLGRGVYGQRQSVWLTLKPPPMPRTQARMKISLLSMITKNPSSRLLDPTHDGCPLLSEWIAAGEMSWGSFILDSLVKKELPPTFPSTR